MSLREYQNQYPKCGSFQIKINFTKNDTPKSGAKKIPKKILKNPGAPFLKVPKIMAHPHITTYGSPPPLPPPEGCHCFSLSCVRCHISADSYFCQLQSAQAISRPNIPNCPNFFRRCQATFASQKFLGWRYWLFATGRQGTRLPKTTFAPPKRRLPPKIFKKQ